MKKQVLLAVAALALSGAAAAQTYGVVSIGSSKIGGLDDCSALGASCDDTGTAFKLLGGYKFTPNFALEGGYMNFGKATISGPGGSVSVKSDAFVVGGAFHQDFSQSWNFVARLGLARVKAKASGVFSASDTSTEAYGGLGLGYKLTKQMSLDASLDLTKAGDENVRALSLGVTYSF